MVDSTALKFEGASRFRQRIVMSLLSGRAVKFENIRALDERPGLKGNNDNMYASFNTSTSYEKIPLCKSMKSAFSDSSINSPTGRKLKSISQVFFHPFCGSCPYHDISVFTYVLYPELLAAIASQ